MKDSLFTDFAAVERSHWWFVARREIVLAAAAFLPTGSPVLDLGCGTGFVLEGLQARFDAHGLDVSPIALELCRRRGLSQVSRGSTDDLSALGRRRFQAVFLLDVLEHLDDDAEALRRASQALVPGGTAVITVPAFMFLWSSHDDRNEHKRRYSRRQLAELLRRAGFEVKLLTYFNSYLFPLALAARVAGRMLGPYAPGGLALPPKWVNTTLRRIFESEKQRILSGGFPVGVSLLAIGEHRERA